MSLIDSILHEAPASVEAKASGPVIKAKAFREACEGLASLGFDKDMLTTTTIATDGTKTVVANDSAIQSTTALVNGIMAGFR